jgi:hypothetical protein
MLILLFLAVTSATSAELIAVSSILTYDVYKVRWTHIYHLNSTRLTSILQRYINPNATEQQILRVSHYMIAAYAIFMGIAGTIFFYIGVSMGWLYTFMGVILGSAVVPIALCITWKKASKWGCIAGAVSGFICGIIAWLVTTSQRNPTINVTTSGGDYEMLAGNLAAIGVGGIVSVVWSYIKPDDFNFDITRSINSPHALHDVMDVPVSDAAKPPSDSDSKNEKEPIETVVPVSEKRAGITSDKDWDPVALKKAFRFAAWASVVLVRAFILQDPYSLLRDCHSSFTIY